MKSTIILLSVSLLTLVSCKKDKLPEAVANNTPTEKDLNLTITQDQNATMFFYTSTGCPGCGSWGGPAFEDLSAQHQTNVTPIAVHIKYGDPFVTASSQAIADNRTGQKYTPQIHIGNKNIVVLVNNSIDDNASISQANDSIASNSSVTPIASCGSIYEIDGSTITLKYGAEFYQEATGEYYVSAYLLEDGLYNYQSGANPSNAEHNNVIRLVADGNPFGNLIHSGTINQGEIYTNQLNLTVHPDWNANNLKVATVLWLKEGSEYKVVNSSVFKL